MMKYIKTYLIVLSVMAFVFAFTPHITNAAASCPFTAGGNTYVVQFPTKTLFSDKGLAKSEVSTAANIPAGTYNVTLHTYDNHSAHGGQGQTKEKYHLIMKKSNGSTITSNESNDIPENENTVTTLVNSNLVIDSEITEITAKHSAYRLAGNNQSLVPTCAKFEKVEVVPPPTPMTASCTVSQTNPLVDEQVVYTATAQGGNGSYTYEWVGTFTSVNNRILTASYANPGTYPVSITVKDSAGKSAVAQCSQVVVIRPVTPVPSPNPSLSGYCTISPSSVRINQDVQFIAYPAGGSGNYSYHWSGIDSSSYYSDRSFIGRFYNPGYKTATVTITSGSQSITRTCSVQVEPYEPIYQPPVYYPPVYTNPIQVSCTANPTNANIGQNVVWTAYATGGNGYYTYAWTGTDGLTYGNASAIQKVYTTSGYKTATVTAYSNGQSVSATCSTNIVGGSVLGASTATVIREPNAGTPISGVFLSEVPATGINGNLKVFLFVLGLALWSGFLGYMVVVRNKKSKLALQANRTGSTGSDIHARIQAFKLANMQKKGLVK